MTGPCRLSGKDEHLRKMKCAACDPEVTGLNQGQIELRVCTPV